MYYCSKHSLDHRSFDCPRCFAEQQQEELLEETRQSYEEAEQHAQERHEEAIRAREDSDYKRANPGDYQCPHCMYVTLKRTASRCPMCHGAIDSEYWTALAAAEVRAAKLEAERIRLANIAAAKKEAADKVHRQEQAEAAAADERKTAALKIGMTVCVLASLASLVIFSDHIKPTGTDSQKTSVLIPAPPEQIVDSGVCPGEGCTYGEQWTATKDMYVYDNPPNRVGASLSSLHKKTVIHVGDWVRTETGMVLARRLEGRIDLNLRPTFGVAVVSPPQLTQGQSISLYSYLGEGCWRAWIEGTLLPICGINSSGQPQNEWWIQIVLVDGSKAWTKRESFVSREDLNNTVAARIADADLPLQDKLTQIDALLAAGADLNGSSGKYGTSPIAAAIEARDVDLLRTLIAKGLDISRDQNNYCVAYSAAGTALLSNGDVMLEFLLENGMPLTCVKGAAASGTVLNAFLRQGIRTAGYSVDQAVRVAGILVKYGVSTQEKDSQGKSILDELDQYAPGNAARVNTLKAALSKLDAEEDHPAKTRDLKQLFK